VGWLSKLLGKAGDDVEPLVVVPMPPLVTLLQQQKSAKGSSSLKMGSLAFVTARYA
jgi:hypothetical protein